MKLHFFYSATGLTAVVFHNIFILVLLYAGVMRSSIRESARTIIFERFF